MIPLGDEKLDALISSMALPADPTVLDINCDKGELLIRVLESYGGSGQGVTPNPLFLSGARAEAATRLRMGQIEWLTGEAYELEIEQLSYDAVMCLRDQPYGGTRETLAKLWAFVPSGGVVVYGDYYWRQENPPYDYLEAIGCGPETYLTHQGLFDAALAETFTPLYSVSASREEFDHLEWTSVRSVERYVRANPFDDEARAMKERIRGWRDAYTKWGRDHLGYAAMLLLK